MAQMNFDASSVEPSQPFDIIPPGRYEVHIIESEEKLTKTGDGKYINLTMEVLSGPYAGRKLWDLLNLQNPNPKAVEIAQRTLSAICHAVGQMNLRDTEQLHFKPLIASVKVEPAGPDRYGVQRDAKNKVAGYTPVGAGAPQQRLPAAQPRPAPAPPPRPAPTQQPQRTAPQAAPPQAAPPPPAAPQGGVPPWRRAG